MTIQEIIDRALQVRKKYDLLNEANGVKWEGRDFMAGFVGDVGDLSKIIMAKQGLRGNSDVDEALAHELADCLWSVCIIANEYDVDLETAFAKTMDELDKRLDRR